MSAFQIILVAIFAAICGMSSILDQFEIYQPLIACSVMGLILGDPTQGVMLGAQLQLITMGWMNIGAAVAPDPALAALISSILVCFYKQDLGTGMAIAIPIAAAGQILSIFARSLAVGFQHKADVSAEKGNLFAIDACNLGALVLQALRVVIPVLIVALINAHAVTVMLNAIPDVIKNGLTVAGGFIVVVGYAMVIQMIEANYLMPFFFLGFVIAIFSKFNLVALGIVGACLGIIYIQLNPKYIKKAQSAQSSVASDDDLDALLEDDLEDDFESDSFELEEQSIPQVEAEPQVAAAVEVTRENRLTKSDLIKMWFRSIFLQASWNYEKMQALGWCYQMVPAIKRLYKTKEDRAAALKRHLVFFNTTPFTANPILGVVAAMEEEKANGSEIDEKVINNVKVGLMGPFAGVGDPVFWGTLRPIFAGVGASLALAGNWIGVIFFFVGWNALTLGFRWVSIKYGYKTGTSIIKDMAGDKLQKLTEGSSILGLFIMGALIARWTKIDVPLVISKIKNPQTGHMVTTTVQSVLNELLPGLLALVLTFACMKLLKKKVGPIWIIFGLFAIGILGYACHILGIPPVVK